MTLSEWRRVHGLTQAAIAERVGLDVTAISRFENGRRRVPLDVAIRIERETGGAVPATSWVDGAQSAPAAPPEAA